MCLNSDVAAVSGDFFGMHGDNMYHIPSNISTVVNLLKDMGVSWATYQENMAADSLYGIGCVRIDSPGASVIHPS
jgi:endo-1,4-beta-mannosidase